MATIYSTSNCLALPSCEVQIRHVDGYPGYAVSEDGEVWTCKNGKWGFKRSWKKLRPALNSKGYRQVGLCLKGRQRPLKIATLVALTFLGPRPNGYEVCHNDGVKTHDCLQNLRWGTSSANSLDSVRHGTAFCLRVAGDKNPRAIFTGEDIVMIRTLFSFCTNREIAGLYNVREKTISAIKTGQNWSSTLAGCDPRTRHSRQQRGR